MFQDETELLYRTDFALIKARRIKKSLFKRLKLTCFVLHARMRSLYSKTIILEKIRYICITYIPYASLMVNKHLTCFCELQRLQITKSCVYELVSLL